MNNSYDEIKKLLKASNNMLGKNSSLNEEISEIRKSYGIISEQEDLTQKINPIEDAEKEIEDSKETESKSDKQQSYRISGGVITLHGKKSTDLELTTDDKTAFQETIDELEKNDLKNFIKYTPFPSKKRILTFTSESVADDATEEANQKSMVKSLAAQTNASSNPLTWNSADGGERHAPRPGSGGHGTPGGS